MAGEMDAGIIDLPQAVKRRKRKVRTAPKLKSIRKTGHLYSDFRKYISENYIPVVQMDCVEGKKSIKPKFFIRFNTFLTWTSVSDMINSSCLHYAVVGGTDSR